MMKTEVQKMLDTAKNFFVRNKTSLILLVTGIVMLTIPSLKEADAQNDISAGEDTWTAVYSLEETEKRLAEVLSAIDGVGDVDVMLTLKTGTERVLAEDRKRNEYMTGEENGEERQTEEEISVVIIENDDGENAVTVKYIFPEYLGALIVAEGAGTASVRLSITEAVMSLTGLSVGDITVLNMKK